MNEEQQISEQLRQAREQQGKSLEEVGRQTGLSINVLQGLETDRFDVVEPVFTRMTLHTYAEHLGLDVAAILEQYDSCFGLAVKPVEIQIDPSASSSTSASSFPFDASTLRAMGLGVVGLILVLLVVYFFGDVMVERDVVPSRSAVPAPSSERKSPPPRRQAPTVPSRTAAAEVEGSLPAEAEQKPLPASETSEEREEIREAVPALPAADVEITSAAGEGAVDAEETTSGAEEGASDTGEIAADAKEATSAAGEGASDTGEIASDTGETVPAAEEIASDSDVSPVASPETGVETDSAVGGTVGESEALETDVSAAAPTVANAGSVDAAEEPVEAPELESIAVDENVSEEAVPAALVSAAADSLLLLEIEAVDSTWVQVRWDKNGIFAGIVPRGEKRSWQARDRFMVHSGRPHGLRYWFQGRLLGGGRLGDPTKHLRFRASSAGVTLLGPDLQPLEPVEDPVAPVEDQP